MAACGLEAGRRDSMHSAESEENFNDNVIKVMAQFAVEMMAVLDKLKRKSFYTSKPYRCVLISCKFIFELFIKGSIVSD